MEQKIKLSKRLRKAASYLPEGSLFADIGSDHAYLPCYVCAADPAAKAIAGEINKGPYKNALQTVRKYYLVDRISVRLGDGLNILQPGEINALVITGMGGALIRSILASGKDKLMGVNRIIAQPNNEAEIVRRWLLFHGYGIRDEDILEENGHIYEIIVADQAVKQTALTEKELLFGPVLLKKQSDVFIKKWEHEYKKGKYVVEQMKKAAYPDENKLLQYKTKLDWIKEVIQLEE
jgi:tRNA (adenine22-N1)-methyltransferase